MCWEKVRKGRNNWYICYSSRKKTFFGRDILKQNFTSSSRSKHSFQIPQDKKRELPIFVEVPSRRRCISWHQAVLLIITSYIVHPYYLTRSLMMIIRFMFIKERTKKAEKKVFFCWWKEEHQSCGPAEIKEIIRRQVYLKKIIDKKIDDPNVVK